MATSLGIRLIRPSLQNSHLVSQNVSLLYFKSVAAQPSRRVWQQPCNKELLLNAVYWLKLRLDRTDTESFNLNSLADKLTP